MFGVTFTRALREALPTAARCSARLPPIPVGPSSSRWASSYVHLGDLADNKGAREDNVRLGRGWSSTKGGTSGRGHKGQKARAGNGKPKAGFEGGQTPITRLFPKRGFNNFTSKTYAPINISKLQEWIAAGKLDPSQPIDVGTVFQSNLVHGIKGFAGVKLLGQPDSALPLPPLNLRFSRYSKSAAQAIIDAGGEVTAVYHNQLALRQAAHPEKFFGREVKEALPVRKTDILYYSNPAKHGYLAKENAPTETESTTA
ncbi:YmL10 [Naganishia albida]|nr:YmL10 [Naganishia albida]